MTGKSKSKDHKRPKNHQKHLRWTMAGPHSSYSCLEIHICWKVEREARMDPPIQTEYFLSGGAMILILMVDGANEREDEPRRHGRLQPALWQGGAWRDAPPPNDGPRRGNAKPCQCCRWQAWLQRSSQPECAGSRQKGAGGSKEPVADDGAESSCRANRGPGGAAARHAAGRHDTWPARWPPTTATAAAATTAATKSATAGHGNAAAASATAAATRPMEQRGHQARDGDAGADAGRTHAGSNAGDAWPRSSWTTQYAWSGSGT